MAFRQIIKRCYSSGSGLKKWAYNASGFNKYGLMHDDCLYEDDNVKEALRRLPEKLLHERNYRLVRAMQLTITHDILPKEEWTKYEDDVRYLKPYLEQVEKEIKEREEWEDNH
ncbi:cytochrome b-c1 complex subunit 7 [Halyomorpha halys]|uniref:cytochrome b-c1 complex subunit 7 n=1 Tax=Halyomorpha halys TaxID=286706 RepID=UPI0006D4DBAF|nr:cytochrome b-c1 complex subunit 7 [Halyomorpha halys]